KSAWRYNEKGDVIEISNVDVRRNKKMIIKSSYDRQGNRTGTWVITDHDTINANTYAYNAKNNPELVQLASNGKQWKYTYEYDEQGNWVVQNQYDEAGILVYRIHRKYSYY
ncbi:MAG TPA: hypothetical protein VD905_09355, partial [Flavobacteriales bacterium]|nr:hypothetical protein [Flavobacteriales bacterium]